MVWDQRKFEIDSGEEWENWKGNRGPSGNFGGPGQGGAHMLRVVLTHHAETSPTLLELQPPEASDLPTAQGSTSLPSCAPWPFIRHPFPLAYLVSWPFTWHSFLLTWLTTTHSFFSIQIRAKPAKKPLTAPPSPCQSGLRVSSLNPNSPRGTLSQDEPYCIVITDILYLPLLLDWKNLREETFHPYNDHYLVGVQYMCVKWR